MERSGIGQTVVTTEFVLFAVNGSGKAPAIQATLVMADPVAGTTVNVIVAEPSTPSGPRSIQTGAPFVCSVPCDAIAAFSVTEAGRLFVSRTDVANGPPLVTVMV